MNNQLVANVLGYNAMKNVNSRLPDYSSAGVGGLGGSFDSTLAKSFGNLQTRSTGPRGIVEMVGDDMAGLLDRISASGNLDERRSLALVFREAVISALKQATLDVREGEGADKIIVNGVIYDILSTLNTPGAKVGAQYIRFLGSGSVNPGNNTPTRSIADVVFSTGNANAELINKINVSTTLNERLQYVVELRDKVIDALNESGHSAFDIGKPDKIVIDGTIYDVFRSSRGVGMNTAVQLLVVGPYIDGRSVGIASAIFNGVSQGVGILRQISNSFDLSERRQFGYSLQEMLVNSLNSSGFTASAHADPDKVVINGTTYDFIQNLNRVGEIAAFQALLVA